jgi:isocitrate lyase
MAGAKKSTTSAPKPASSDASLHSRSSAASAVFRIPDTVIHADKRAIKLTEKAAAAVKMRLCQIIEGYEGYGIDPYPFRGGI